MSTHVVTQIKKEVDEARAKQYAAHRNQRELKYFSLHLKSVTKIQRFLRRCLAAKTAALEKALSWELQRK